MKKIIVLFSILILSLFIVSCKEKPVDTMDELSENTLLRIKKDYIKFTNEDLSVEDIAVMYYYGKYNDSYAVVMHSIDAEYSEWEWAEKVGSVEITYSSGYFSMIYNNGQFYRLPEAFDKGLISENDLLQIKENTKRSFYDDFFKKIDKNS